MTPRRISSSNLEIGNSTNSTVSPLSPTLHSILVRHLTPPLRNLLCEYFERFREILSCYEKADPHFPFSTISICLTAAKLLAAMIKYRFNSPIIGGGTCPGGLLGSFSGLGSALTSGIGGVSSSFGLSGGPPTTIVSGGVVIPSISNDRKDVSPATKQDVCTWVMKAWSSGLDDLISTDQISVCVDIAAIFSMIGMSRKRVFFLRQVGLLVLSSIRFNGKWKQSAVNGNRGSGVENEGKGEGEENKKEGDGIEFKN